jgi:hypothetical protein
VQVPCTLQPHMNLEITKIMGTQNETDRQLKKE